MHKPPLPSRNLERARSLRRDMTDAERKLWRCLRAGQLDGFRLRRLHPIPPYGVDFCRVEKKPIIELDGSQHDEATDARRTRFLQSQGWRVLRFWDNDALAQTEAVVDTIWNLVAAPNLHPHPSRDGRGALEPSP